MFFLIHFIVYGWRSSYKEKQDWDYISRFIPRYICVPVASQDLDFQRHMSWFFSCSVSWVEMRSNCSLGWCKFEQLIYYARFAFDVIFLCEIHSQKQIIDSIYALPILVPNTIFISDSILWRLAVTRVLSLVEQERLTLPEHLSLVYYCLFFYPFTFDHCVVCPSFNGSPQFSPNFYWSSYIAQSVVFCRVLCILLIVILVFYFWWLHC